MKKIIVAIADDTEMNDALKTKAECFAEKHSAEIQGIMQYPSGLPVMDPQIVIESIKMTKADYVITSSSDFLISELAYDSLISKTLKQNDIDVYDLNLELRFDEIMKLLSPSIKEQFQEMGESHTKEGKNVLFVCGENETTDMMKYAIELSQKQNVAQLGQLQVIKFNLDTANEVRRIIKEEDISEVIFYDEFNTKAYDDLIDELQNSDITLTFPSNTQNIGFEIIMN
ncbi:hypothetical protein [Amedibacillus sp. YH-ame10]